MSSASLRLFAASIDGRGQPLLLKGEVQRGLIRKVRGIAGVPAF